MSRNRSNAKKAVNSLKDLGKLLPVVSKKNAMKTAKKKKTKGLLTGVAIGAAVGAAAGVLLAPKSGKETRKDLADTAKKVADKSKKTAVKVKDKVVDKVSGLKGAIGEKLINNNLKDINTETAEIDVEKDGLDSEEE